MENNNSKIMNWENLLNVSRFCDNNQINSGAEKITKERSPFLVDLDRITFSNYFRTLQDKTQVHPLSKDGRVRSRLTHSIEVASVGRSLGFGASQIIKEKKPNLDIDSFDIGYIVQAACLAHDIGNPPFGHQTEIAIQTWFKNNKDLLQGLTEDQQADFFNYDGNAQGFRVLNNLGMYKQNGGFRLTFASLGSFVKYPRTSSLKEPSGYIGEKKSGILQSEQETFKTIARSLGLIKKSDSSWARHPLVFLVEAADDICYSVADLEDGFNINMVDFREVEELISPMAIDLYNMDSSKTVQKNINMLLDQSWYKEKSKTEKLGFLRGKAIGYLIKSTLKQFQKQEEELLKGTLTKDLLSLTPYAEYINNCKKFASKNIYISSANNIMGVACFDILDNLFSKISSSLLDWYAINNLEDNQEKDDYFQKTQPYSYAVLNNLLGDVYKNKNKKPLEKYQLLLNMLDFISALSDHQILKLHRQIKGVK